ncbi:MAG: phosphatase, partial [Hafnia alvei]|nr:phosphatase [Hafnia alvei]
MAILQDTLLESEEVTLSPQPLFDLHSHTTASDGLLSSAELVSR